MTRQSLEKRRAWYARTVASLRPRGHQVYSDRNGPDPNPPGVWEPFRTACEVGPDFYDFWGPITIMVETPIERTRKIQHEMKHPDRSGGPEREGP